MIGERFGSYTVIDKSGEGGMGAVYLAVHPMIEGRVAVKVLLPELTGREDAMARFLAEAKATARLRHPAIVDIIDFGRHQSGYAFIIMEYLAGETLAGLIRRSGRLSPTMSVRIALQIADGIGAAHAEGIVHRDLKPDDRPQSASDVVARLEELSATLPPPAADPVAPASEEPPPQTETIGGGSGGTVILRHELGRTRFQRASPPRSDQADAGNATS